MPIQQDKLAGRSFTGTYRVGRDLLPIRPFLDVVETLLKDNA
jgi:hypothetical protein